MTSASGLDAPDLSNAARGPRRRPADSGVHGPAGVVAPGSRPRVTSTGVGLPRNVAVVDHVTQSLQLRADLVAQIAADRSAYDLPTRLPDVAERLIHAYLALLFPHYTGEAGCRAGEVPADVRALVDLLEEALALPGTDETARRDGVAGVLAALPAIREALLLDAEQTAAGDPAASGVDEVILAYPGFFATAVYRLAHHLYNTPVPVLPRLLCEIAHRATGIDIHPGAQIGSRFAVDHGTGLVVGETCVIGDRVRLYQGVTLGALVVEKSMASSKRHPTVEDDVVVYSGATILGGDTVIGAGSRIGGNVWLTRSVPAGSFVTTSAGLDRRRSRDGPAATGEESGPELEFHL